MNKPQRNTRSDTMTTKTTAKHTSGKWDICRMGNKISIVSITENKRTGEEICRISMADIPVDDIANANARLIAAAPELLAACKDAVVWMGERNYAIIKSLTDAITKASSPA
jgi:hypothetical protein